MQKKMYFGCFWPLFLKKMTQAEKKTQGERWEMKKKERGIEVTPKSWSVYGTRRLVA